MQRRDAQQDSQTDVACCGGPHCVTLIFSIEPPDMESNMAKEVQQKKQEKKKPAKTLMEKRAQKQAKKAEKGR